MAGAKPVTEDIGKLLLKSCVARFSRGVLVGLVAGEDQTRPKSCPNSVQVKKKGLEDFISGPLKKNGSAGRTRTCDKVVNSHLLYQLSYRGSDARGLYQTRACLQRPVEPMLLEVRAGIEPAYVDLQSTA